ncbi:GNAT family N-acetyltransferase [Bacillus sp. SJS]|uniref:GNAT family N-acetyltransferase n=1 Tax=Bacillus sp. SJS TaxID=1423321 RepID=UPI0018D32FE0|nr:GNAT family N-acetyltransferase [Bacillus sp. SJS]
MKFCKQAILKDLKTGSLIMELNVITSFKDLQLQRDSWTSILAEKGNTIPFIEWDWINCWWKHYGHNFDLRVLQIIREEKIIGYVPLIKEKKRFYSSYSFMGKDKANYMDIIASSSDYEIVFTEGINWLKDQKENIIIEINGIYAGPLKQQLINDVIKEAGLHFFHENTPAPAIEFAGLEAELFVKKRSRKHGMDRKEKKLRKHGKLYLKEIFLKDMDSIFYLHKKRWKDRRDTSGFSSETNINFFKELVQLKSNTVVTCVDGLYFEDKLIAFYYGFQTRGRYLYYLPAHDDDFGVYSPGRLLMKEKVINCMDQETKTFDLSIGYESYKMDWANSVSYVSSFTLVNGRMFIKLGFSMLKLKQIIKGRMKKNKKLVMFIRNKTYKLRPISLLNKIFQMEMFYQYVWQENRDKRIVPEQKTMKDLDFICQATGKHKAEIINRFYKNDQCYMDNDKIVCWIKNINSNPIIYDCNLKEIGTYSLPVTKLPYQIYSSYKSNDDHSTYTGFHLEVRFAGKSFIISRKRKENHNDLHNSEQLDS